VTVVNLTDLTDSSSWSNMTGGNNRVSTVGVNFQDWVVQMPYRLVLTRGISVRFMPCTVRIGAVFVVFVFLFVFLFVLEFLFVFVFVFMFMWFPFPFVGWQVRLSVRYDDRLTDPRAFAERASSWSPPDYSSILGVGAGIGTNTSTTTGAGAVGSDGGTSDTTGVAAVHSNSISDINNNSSSSSSGVLLYLDAAAAAKERKIKCFQASQHVTHVTLTFIPAAIAPAEVATPAVLTFDMPSVMYLLAAHGGHVGHGGAAKVKAKAPSTTPSAAAVLGRQNAPVDFDEILRDGNRKELLRITKKLASLVRVEYTNMGVKYAIVGAFSDPEHVTCAWPADIPNYDDEDELLLLEEDEEGGVDGGAKKTLEELYAAFPSASEKIAGIFDSLELSEAFPGRGVDSDAGAGMSRNGSSRGNLVDEQEEDVASQQLEEEDRDDDA
jgi:hypothetical protein